MRNYFFNRHYPEELDDSRRYTKKPIINWDDICDTILAIWSQEKKNKTGKKEKERKAPFCQVTTDNAIE